jgi:diguanylate cyclase (GGDEF)-like protein
MSQDNQSVDLLTGLLTRQKFEESFGKVLAEAEAKQSCVTLALVDIDNFLQINNQFGHVGGDAVLKNLAEILKHIGEDVLISRYGGDEFAILFPNIEREQAFLKLEMVRAEVERTSHFTDGETDVNLSLTISIGAAAYPIDGSDVNELMRKVDGALYRAKANGRNKILLAYEERMAPKTSHYTLTQLERLAALAKEQGVGEAVLLREALDDLLVKYHHSFLR